jgi:hypothetical protein
VVDRYLPGLVPMHDINGTRYVNGGVRSAEDTNLAVGYANVEVRSPLADAARHSRRVGSRV